jgi:CTP:molybdopterin cytidylyltransferase MocA
MRHDGMAAIEDADKALARAAGAARSVRLKAVLVAGDLQDSRYVSGESKAYLTLAGRPMVVHVLEILLATPELSDVILVGNAERLLRTLGETGALQRAAAQGRAVTIVPQHPTLYENVWHGFLASLPPGTPDPDSEVLVVPADIPLAVPEEISQFIARARAADADYVLGLTPSAALEPFAPRDGQPGIRMACFNLAEGRFRQSNLHLVRPLRMGHREYIQEMYRARYQKQLSSMLKLAFQVMRRELRHLWVLIPYLVLHVAGVLDRRGHVRAADLVRRFVSLRTIERCGSLLLQTRFALVTTELGGAAMDVDNDEDRAAAETMFDTWNAMQRRQARAALRAVR